MNKLVISIILSLIIYFRRKYYFQLKTTDNWYLFTVPIYELIRSDYDIYYILLIKKKVKFNIIISIVIIKL